MVDYKTIQDYNQYLINNQLFLNIIDYVKEINIIYNIDINFINDFIELVSEDKCCIHYNMLQKYGILTLNKGTTDINRLLEQNNFIENEDYQLRNVAELRPQGGSSIKNKYFLHPRAFKICLIRSKNTKIYANYYLLLEECIKYFNDYQNILKEKYIIKLKTKNKENKIIIKEKDDKIDELIKINKETNIKLSETSNEVKQLLKLNKRLDKQSRILEDKLNDANFKLDDIKDDLADTNNTLELTCKKLDIASNKSVPEPSNKYKLEDFVLLKNRNRKMNYRYYAIRAQTKYVNNKVEKMITVRNYKELIRINNVANSVNIWNRLKEFTKNKVEYCGNELKLLSIDDSKFIRIINQVYDKRKDIIIDDEEEYSDYESE